MNKLNIKTVKQIEHDYCDNIGWDIFPIAKMKWVSVESLKQLLKELVRIGGDDRAGAYNRALSDINKRLPKRFIFRRRI